MKAKKKYNPDTQMKRANWSKVGSPNDNNDDKITVNVHVWMVMSIHNWGSFANSQVSLINKVLAYGDGDCELEPISRVILGMFTMSGRFTPVNFSHFQHID